MLQRNCIVYRPSGYLPFAKAKNLYLTLMNALDFLFPAAIGVSVVITLRIAEKKKNMANFRKLLLADSDQQIAESIKEENLPPSLRMLIPYAQKYSVGDDLLRTQLGMGLNKNARKELIAVVGPLLTDINKFLDSFGDDPLSDEAIVMGSLAEFTCELALHD